MPSEIAAVLAKLKKEYEPATYMECTMTRETVRLQIPFASLVDAIASLLRFKKLVVHTRLETIPHLRSMLLNGPRLLHKIQGYCSKTCTEAA